MENIDIHGGDLKDQLSWDGGAIEELNYGFIDKFRDQIDYRRTPANLCDEFD